MPIIRDIIKVIIQKKILLISYFVVDVSGTKADSYIFSVLEKWGSEKRNLPLYCKTRKIL